LQEAQGQAEGTQQLAENTHPMHRATLHTKMPRKLEAGPFDEFMLNAPGAADKFQCRLRGSFA
jgi:hypothetical protein